MSPLEKVCIVFAPHLYGIKSIIPYTPRAYFGETLSKEAKKVLGYLIAKNFLGFLCAYQNHTFMTSLAKNILGFSPF